MREKDRCILRPSRRSIYKVFMGLGMEDAHIWPLFSLAANA
jgi:hypothetical protein